MEVMLVEMTYRVVHKNEAIIRFVTPKLHQSDRFSQFFHLNETFSNKVIIEDINTSQTLRYIIL